MNEFDGFTDREIFLITLGMRKAFEMVLEGLDNGYDVDEVRTAAQNSIRHLS